MEVDETLNKLYPVFEIRGFRLSESTKYSDGQPQLAMELSVGKPAHISGTIQHTKMADHSLERIQHKDYGNVGVVFLRQLLISEKGIQVLKTVSKAKFRHVQNILDI